MTLRSVVRVLLSCVLHSVEFLSHLHLDSFAKYKTCAKIFHLFMREKNYISGYMATENIPNVNLQKKLLLLFVLYFLHTFVDNGTDKLRLQAVH